MLVGFNFSVGGAYEHEHTRWDTISRAGQDRS